MRDVLDFLNDDLEVDAMMISPAYAYEKAPDQEHFLGVDADAASCSATAFADGRRRKWRLNHTPLFLDFLEGRVDFECTAWAIPSLLGARLAAAVLPDERRLRGDVPGARRDHRLGALRARARIPRCANCMAHCGYEPTAVVATTHSLRESLRALVNTR